MGETRSAEKREKLRRIFSKVETKNCRCRLLELEFSHLLDEQMKQDQNENDPDTFSLFPLIGK